MAKVKTAVCTHCGNDIGYNTERSTWVHTDTGKVTCTVIEIATPRRGTIKTS